MTKSESAASEIDTAVLANWAHSRIASVAVSSVLGIPPSQVPSRVSNITQGF